MSLREGDLTAGAEVQGNREKAAGKASPSHPAPPCDDLPSARKVRSFFFS